MPTLFSHAVLPLAVCGMAGRANIPVRVAALGALLAMVPDADVVSFPLGIGYGDVWGHRGATHSFAFAALVVTGVTLVWQEARTAGRALFLFAAMASHPLLDMLTDGGHGVALFWPFDTTRYFLPWQPIRVAPIGVRFFSGRGLETVASELLLIWLPSALVIASGWLWRHREARR
jgi:inner membrane protein